MAEITARTPPTSRHAAFSKMIEPCKSIHKANGQSLHVCCAEIGRYIEQADDDRRALLSQVSRLTTELALVRDDWTYAREELQKLRVLRDGWLALLSPASPEETVDGAIRNLQQSSAPTDPYTRECPGCVADHLGFHNQADRHDERCKSEHQHEE